MSGAYTSPYRAKTFLFSALSLLLSPPLAKYQPIEFPAKQVKGLASKQILLGGSDEVVDPSETLTFLGEHLKTSELNITIDPRLGHRIPLSVFEEQVKIFFSNICY